MSGTQLLGSDGQVLGTISPAASPAQAPSVVPAVASKGSSWNKGAVLGGRPSHEIRLRLSALIEHDQVCLSG